MIPLVLVLGLASAEAGVEAPQVVFLLDHSESMQEFAFDFAHPTATRWTLTRQAYPAWFDRLDSQALVGALSVGGACDEPPAIRLPAGTPRDQVRHALESVSPGGGTPLNAMLLAAPGLFRDDVQGSRHLVLLSDGLNTCPPETSTCDIARDLHRDHHIAIDVVSLVTDPSVADEFRCVTEATGGTFSTPTTPDEFARVPLPAFDLWRYIAMVLGTLTMLTTGRLLYRHAHHALGWASSKATLAGALLFTAGTFLTYLVLFVGTGVVAAALGLAVLGAVLVFAARREWQPAALAGRGLPLLLALAASLPGIGHAATPPLPQACDRVVSGAPRRHHVVALDQSGSVARAFPQMKALIGCYARMYALPGETMTVLAFGTDEQSSVRELRTFDIPADGNLQPLQVLLDDLAIQNAAGTRTYFEPLSIHLSDFLRHVRLDPVVLVLSDGLSDAWRDPPRAAREVTFESFGARGIYNAPGIRDWRVAIQGGAGLDFTPLFAKPLTPRAARERTSAAPALDPCLVSPELLAEIDSPLTLRPRWNPFDKTVSGTLDLSVRHACGVTRFRSFAVAVKQGDATWPVGEVRDAEVGEQRRLLPLVWSRRAAGLEDGSAIVLITVDQGGGTTRTVYATSRTPLRVVEIPYLDAYGPAWAGTGAILLVLAGVALRQRRRRAARQRSAPLLVRVFGGSALPLHPNQPVPLGAGGLTVPDVPPGTALGTLAYTGTPGTVTVQPAGGFHVRIDGMDSLGGPCRLGQRMEFVRAADGKVYAVTLQPAAPRDLSLGLDQASRGRGLPDLGLRGATTTHGPII